VTGFVYGLLTKVLLNDLGKELCKGNQNIIALIHDRCPYDGCMAEAFNQMLDDPGFTYRKCFSTLAPMGWEHCIPLQPADLIAYENFKDACRQIFPRRRRKSLDLVIESDSFAGHSGFITREALVELRAQLERQKDQQNPSRKS
jgi:hypothetical protein